MVPTRIQQYPAWMFSPIYLERLALRFCKDAGIKTQHVGVKLTTIAALWPERQAVEGSVKTKNAKTVSRLSDTQRDAAEQASREEMARRLEALIEFTGLPFYQFGKRMGLPYEKDDKGRERCAALSKVLKKSLPPALADKIGKEFGFNPSWFLWDRFDVPEPLSRVATTRDKISYWQRLFDDLNPDVDVVASLESKLEREAFTANQHRLHAGAVAVIHGKKRLSDFGITAGAPSWAEPFIVAGRTFVDYVRASPGAREPRRVPWRVRTLQPPDGVPACTWADVTKALRSK